MISVAEYERLRRPRVSSQDAYQQFLKTHSPTTDGVDSSPPFVDGQIAAIALVND